MLFTICMYKSNTNFDPQQIYSLKFRMIAGRETWVINNYKEEHWIRWICDAEEIERKKNLRIIAAYCWRCLWKIIGHTI